MALFVEYTEPVWRGLNMRELGVDQSYMVVKSHYEKPAYLYSRSEECYTCPYILVNSEQNFIDKLHIIYDWEFKVYTEKSNLFPNNEIGCDDTICNKVCEINVPSSMLQEFGVYNFTIQENGNCNFVTDKAGVDVNIPIASVVIIFILLSALIRLSRWIWRSYIGIKPAAVAAANEVNIDTKPKKPSKRVNCLDTFRGTAIILMIFAMNGSGSYWWMGQSTWNGLHFADVVFPSFVWIMGVCIPISLKSQISQRVPKLKICQRIVWRSIKLFVIGLCLNSVSGPQMSDLRIMGVLQRFAVAYLLCGLAHTLCLQRQSVMPQVSWKRSLHDVFSLKGEFLVMLSLIALHLAIVFGLPVPNCPTGYLGPGGRHSYGNYANCTGGASGYIDRLILGNSHLYQDPTAQYTYHTQSFDPEGLFGCILTSVQAFMRLEGFF